MPQIAQHMAANAVWLAIAVAFPPLLIWFAWRWLPPRVQRVLRWLDDQIPGDFSALYRPASFVLVSALSVTIVVPSVFAVLWGLGVNIDQVRHLFAEFGWKVGAWALNPGLKVLLVLAFAGLVQRLVSRAVPRAVGNYLRSRYQGEGEGEPEPEIQKRTQTLVDVLTKTLSLLVLLGTLFMILAQIGVNLAPALAAAGVIGIAVGFGAQNLIRDVFAGIFIILENQYRIGDVVQVAGIGGLVEDINLRRTVLRDLDFSQHFIPNGEIRVATNLTKGKSRVNMNISVAYKEDLEQVIKVLNEIGQDLAKDSYFGPLILDPIKVLRVDNFAESGIELKVLGETLPIRQWDVAGEYRLRVKRAFDRLGIEIPFPHRTLYWGKGERR
ncbi:MAG: mechanosensitive ion channel family protein [Chloroflexi bacterium]|nr:mechanosensitive ion channel family protein [Chloroflexota bacterium]